MAIYHADKLILLEDIPKDIGIVNIFLHEVYDSCKCFDFHIEKSAYEIVKNIKVTYENIRLVEVKLYQRNDLPAVKINGRVTTKIDKAKKLFYSWAVIPSDEEIIHSKRAAIESKIRAIAYDQHVEQLRSPYSALARLPDKVRDKLFGSLELREAIYELLCSAGADKETLTEFFRVRDRACGAAHIRSEFEKGNGYLLCKLSHRFLVSKNKMVDVCEDTPEEIKRQVGLLKLVSDDEGVTLLPNIGCKVGDVYFVLEDSK